MWRYWLPALVLFAASGCGSTSVCGRRPWECGGGASPASAGSASVLVPSGTGSCDSYVPPDYSALVTNTKLPDPFMSPANVTRIQSAAEWECRRAEISAQAQKFELGTKPDAPASVSGSFDGSNIGVTASDGTTTISFSAAVTYPTTGSPPYPAMIGIGGISIGPDQLNAMGVATIVFPNDTLAAQVDGGSRGQGAFYDLYGANHSAGAMIAWAWGVSRLIDAIERTPDAMIDPKHLGVTGCSRNGKGALIVGAFDERIALTIPQESGSGGSASWRISDAQVASGTLVQTLSEITGENVWFTRSFSQFGSSATRLPFDHHMIEGMVAPRALLVIENTSQVWLGNVSTYNDSMAGHLIWEGLGIPDKMGVSQIGDHAHCEWIGSQQPEVSAYVQRFLLGDDSIDTNVLRTDGNYSFDTSSWVDWSVPTLN